MLQCTLQVPAPIRPLATTPSFELLKLLFQPFRSIHLQCQLY